jgi:hypothetical protein
MKYGFQSHGHLEYLRGKDSNAWKSVEKKYASKLVSTSWLKKQRIKFQMQREFNRLMKEGHKPSAKTLW